MINSYISVDLETTGLNPKLDKIIEVGMVKVCGGEVTDTYSKLLNPRRALKEEIVSLTGITDSMLTEAVSMDQVIHEIFEFCNGFPLLGHHIIFDYSFLKQAATNYGLNFEEDGIDTLALCRRFMPYEEKKNLSNACKYFGIELDGAHRAFADAMAAHMLYQSMKKSFGEGCSEVFSSKTLIYKAKKAQPASKRQKEHLRDLIKYHKICLTVQIDYLSRNEISRITDKIISQYGRMIRGDRDV